MFRISHSRNLHQSGIEVNRKKTSPNERKQSFRLTYVNRSSDYFCSLSVRSNVLAVLPKSCLSLSVFYWLSKLLSFQEEKQTFTGML